MKKRSLVLWGALLAAALTLCVGAAVWLLPPLPALLLGAVLAAGLTALLLHKFLPNQTQQWLSVLQTLLGEDGNIKDVTCQSSWQELETVDSALNALPQRLRDFWETARNAAMREENKRTKEEIADLILTDAHRPQPESSQYKLEITDSDWYACHTDETHLMLIHLTTPADEAGDELRAALYHSMVRSLIRGGTTAGLMPKQILIDLEQELGDGFAALHLWLCRIDLANGQLLAASSRQAPPVHHSGEEDVEWKEESSLLPSDTLTADGFSFRLESLRLPHSIVVSCDEEAKGKIHTFADEQFSELSENEIKKMLLVSDEISGIIAKDSGATLLQATCLVKEKKVVLAFQDNGQPYNPLEEHASGMVGAAKSRSIGGLGLFIVRKYMDTTDYRRINENNCLSLTINR